jgi:hypothetical protein
VGGFDAADVLGAQVGPPLKEVTTLDAGLPAEFPGYGCEDATKASGVAAFPADGTPGAGLGGGAGCGLAGGLVGGEGLAGKVGTGRGLLGHAVNLLVGMLAFSARAAQPLAP